MSFELGAESGERAGWTKLKRKGIPDKWSRKGESAVANLPNNGQVCLINISNYVSLLFLTLMTIVNITSKCSIR